MAGRAREHDPLGVVRAPVDFMEVEMPSQSPEQARLMAAAAHSPAFANKVGVPQQVAREFNRHDASTRMLAQANALRSGHVGMQRRG